MTDLALLLTMELDHQYTPKYGKVIQLTIRLTIETARKQLGRVQRPYRHAECAHQTCIALQYPQIWLDTRRNASAHAQ